MVAESVRTAVTPQVVLSRTFYRVADGLFPFHAVVERQPLDDTAAGPADERRAQLFDHRRHILAQSVGAAFVGVAREQRYIVDPDTAFGGEAKAQGVFVSGFRWCEGCRIAVPPAVRRQAHVAHSEGLPVGRDDCGAAPRGLFRPDIKFQIVALARFDGDSPVAAVHGAHFAARRGKVEPQGVGCGGVERIFGGNGRSGLRAVGVLRPPARHRQIGTPPHAEAVDRVVRITVRVGCGGIPVGVERAARREYALLEAAVADHLGVKPAVARTGDLLEEDAVERCGNFGPAFAEIDFDATPVVVSGRRQQGRRAGEGAEQSFGIRIHSVFIGVFRCRDGVRGRSRSRSWAAGP